MNASATPEVVRGAVIAFDEFELDIPGFELRCDGTPVSMEPQVFEVLKVLVENAGTIVTKDEILDTVWPERYVTEAALNSRVMAARKAIGDSGKDQKYIKTIHGRGYRFVGQVREAAPAAHPVQAIPTVTMRVAAVGGPVASTSFVGRESELEQLAELANGGCRMLSIIGPGGIGKTRMAMHLAARLRARGKHVVYVPLETVDVAGLAPAIAEAAGFKLSGDDIAASLAAHLGGAEMVFVLDNFEQLIPEGRAVLAQILESAPGVRFAVTSRVVLGLRGEWVFRAEGLSTEAAEGSLSEAGRLFVERERQADAALRWTPDIDAVNEICRLVAGMPLAIELAAALRRYLGYREIAELIADDLTCLSSDLHDAPDRHRSIEALLDESCRRLPVEQQDMLCVLGVFEGSFSAEAARSVAGASLPVLRALVDSSLVQPRDGRFSLHPLMRQLIVARGGEELVGLREQHATYYARFLDARSPRLETGEQIEACDEIEADLPNVLAAWRWAAEKRRVDLLELGRHGLFCYLTFRGRFYEASEMERVAIEAAEASGDEGLRLLSGLLVHRVWTCFRIGQPTAALGALQRAAAIAEQTGYIHRGIAMDPRVAAAALRVGTGEYSTAYALASAALKSAQQRGDEAAIAFSSWMAGVALFRQVELIWAPDAEGRWQYRPAPSDDVPAPIEEAKRLIDQAAHILEASGERWLMGYVEIERGLIASAYTDIAASCDHYRASYEARRAIGDPQGMASSLIYLCDTLAGMGYLEEARELHAEARDLFDHVGDGIGLAEVDRGEGFRLRNEGDYDGARAMFNSGLQRSMSMNFANNVLGILRGMADMLEDNGETELAGRVHQAIGWNPAATPFARGKSRAAVERLGLAPEPVELDQIALARLADDVVRALNGIREWAMAEPRFDDRGSSAAAVRAITTVPSMRERGDAVA